MLGNSSDPENSHGRPSLVYDFLIILLVEAQQWQIQRVGGSMLSLYHLTLFHKATNSTPLFLIKCWVKPGDGLASHPGESSNTLNYFMLGILRWTSIPSSILGDPGAASRDDGIFMGESLQQERESPWALTLTERVPEAFEIPPSDWPENIFLANQRRGTAGRLSCLLTRGCFPHRMQ